jgi:hypothetical protein
VQGGPQADVVDLSGCLEAVRWKMALPSPEEDSASKKTDKRPERFDDLKHIH